MSENFGSLQYSVIHMGSKAGFRAFGCSVAGRLNFFFILFCFFFPIWRHCKYMYIGGCKVY